MPKLLKISSYLFTTPWDVSSSTLPKMFFNASRRLIMSSQGHSSTLSSKKATCMKLLKWFFN
jgi:hypothetical protein